MRLNRTILRTFALALLSVALMALWAGPTGAATPVVVSSDLFHPYDDMDDHYDLLALHALPELKLLGYVLDQGNSGEQAKRPGAIPMDQMAAITGTAVPYAAGLWPPLSSMKDDGRHAPRGNQAGVELLLKTLRASKEPVDLFVLGSCRDVAAAYLREPALLRRAVRAVYVNAGNGYAAIQDEWNVVLDQPAYLVLMGSRLPIRWYPCFGARGFATLWNVPRQGPLAEGIDPRLKAFLAYALNRTDPKALSPLGALLRTGPEGEADFRAFRDAGPRSFWCAASFLDAAGRRVYERGGAYVALTPSEARRQGLIRDVTPYRMEPVDVSFSMADPPGLGRTVLAGYGQGGRVIPTFHVTTDAATYDRMMASVLRQLYLELSGRLPSHPPAEHPAR
ncbi:MAG TPA: hypothetical protein VGN26_04380 [Armatimonadota bacterium]|jgi:hypothetical protein